jgi:basic membrane protein A
MKDKLRMRGIIALVAVLALVAGACGDDDAATTTTTAAPAATTAAPQPELADFNGDGKVVIGVATDGARDDGSYYQTLVEKIEEISADNGFEAPIIVDLIDPANADSELEALAQQGVDIIAVGSSAIAEGLPALALEYDEIFWYCNCGSGSGPADGIMKSEDQGAELWLSGGYAAGLLLQESGGDSAVFIGCCDLNFEVESYNGFLLGLGMVDESFTATYVPTGNFPFDFNNTAGATEAYATALAEGVDLVVPFLGDAHEPIARLANEDGLIVMTVGPSNGCERDDIDYDFMVKFSAGDYVAPVFAEILSGTAEEGGVRKFTVGLDDEVGAEFCDGATADQVAMLDALNAQIGAGDFGDELYTILADAYGF